MYAVRFPLLRPLAAIVALLAVTLSLGGCAEFTKAKQTIENVGEAIASAKVNRKAVYLAASTANGFIASADIYLQQPICGKIPCRDPRATEPLISAKGSVSSARNAMIAFMNAHPGQLGDQGLYDALVAANTEIQKIFTTYGIKS